MTFKPAFNFQAAFAGDVLMRPRASSQTVLPCRHTSYQSTCRHTSYQNIYQLLQRLRCTHPSSPSSHLARHPAVLMPTRAVSPTSLTRRRAPRSPSQCPARSIAACLEKVVNDGDGEDGEQRQQHQHRHRDGAHLVIEEANLWAGGRQGG